MKHSPLPFIALLFVLPASADEDKQRTAQPTSSSVGNQETTQVLTSASSGLDDPSCYHTDETVGTIYRANGKRLLLEMRGLLIHQLIHRSVAIEERGDAVSRHYYA